MAKPEETRNVEPAEAWIVVLSLISFFVGGAIFSTHSRLIGGILMGVPLLLLAMALLRTPAHQWASVAEAVDRAEKEREKTSSCRYSKN